MNDAAIARLRRALANKRVIPFVGAGVSKAAANLPTWRELLSGMDDFIRVNLKALPKIPDRSTKIERFRELGDCGRFIDAFDLGQEMLGYSGPSNARDAIYYRAFLEQHFGNPDIKDRRAHEAISELRARVVVTTNYDTLLERYAFSKPERSVTWRQPHDALAIVRTDTGVIHLHGRFDDPASLVLSRRDYTQLATANSELLDHISSALFFSGVLLFIGTSLDGLTDPHLGLILDSFGKAAQHDQIASAPHVLLSRGEGTAIERARLRVLGVEVVSYGAEYGDLPSFLNQLTRAQQITIQVDPVRQLIARVRTAQSIQEVIFLAKEFIETYIFAGRQVRVGYVERNPANPAMLESRYIKPPGATGNAFVYPATLAAWSLVSGQIVSYPNDLAKRCDFEWLAKLGKRNRVASAFVDLAQANLSEATLRYLNLSHVIERVRQNSLQVGDFFQDWDGDQPKVRYGQFICVPIPLIDRATNGVEPPEFGVFNIDTTEDTPLLDAESEAHFALLSELIQMAYATHAPLMAELSVADNDFDEGKVTGIA
jgi:SIR2-like domain